MTRRRFANSVVSNQLLDDRAALGVARDRGGYWFFRGVFDKKALLVAGDVSESAERSSMDRKGFSASTRTLIVAWLARSERHALELEVIPNVLKVGDPVYVAADHGTAIFIRPQH